jgi:hypothetical protein
LNSSEKGEKTAKSQLGWRSKIIGSLAKTIAGVEKDSLRLE